MIIMPVPKDIRAVKTKFIGPLTKRQTYAVVSAGIIAAVGFFTFSSLVSMESLIAIISIIDTPILLCGFIDVYGMPFWVYAKDVVIRKILCPKHRPYCTENTYQDYAKQSKITYEYLDGDVEEYTLKEMKRKSKQNKKRLEKFLRDNPHFKPMP